MNLVDENGNKLTGEKKLVDVEGAELQQQKPLTTDEYGRELASHFINSALKFQTNEEINKQFEILFQCALNMIAHRIVNIGLGMEEANAIAEWNASRAFAYEKEVHEKLTATVDKWKEDFFNGELVYHKDKPSEASKA